jgi:hypothetical protein
MMIGVIGKYTCSLFCKLSAKKWDAAIWVSHPTNQKRVSSKKGGVGLKMIWLKPVGNLNLQSVS